MEDYKKKYEEAMFRMNKWVEGSEIIEPKEVAEFIFPELKESEDGRIRESLLKYLKESFNFDGEIIYPEVVNWIAWLEKQGELPHWKKSILPNDTVTGFNSDYFSYNGYYINYKELFNKLPKDNFKIEKQGEQTKQYLYDIIIALWNLLDKIDTFSDLQIDDTNPDNPFRKIEHITQERYKFVKSDGYNLYIKGEQITDFKQGKQKTTNNVEPKFKKE